MTKVSVGIDIGSTTIKVVAWNEEEGMVYSDYVRHHYEVQKQLILALQRLEAHFPAAEVYLSMTGMGAISLAEVFSLPFVQEVAAEGVALRALHGAVDVAIEIGGEDAKITYFTAHGEPDQRMNRMCAGGTGAFLDHLAAFLGTDMQGLNALAEKGKVVYPIASRCGVYAKTDMQALLNQGAGKADLALSAFHAVARQVVSDLAKGRTIEGKVAFLGGPLTFLSLLKDCFMEVLDREKTEVVPVERGELYGALGAALWGRGKACISISTLVSRLQRKNQAEGKAPLQEPLFQDEKEYKAFVSYYEKFHVPCRVGDDWPREVWLGIDAGSTTIKLVLVDAAGRIVYQQYRKNEADLLETAREMVLAMYEAMPEGVRIIGSGITGYGEAFLKQAFQLDFGEVETVAHIRAARFFGPEVTDVLDIGGQDMKYICLQDGVIRDIVLNGSCASGCGVFLETFAGTLGLTMEEFVQKALSARHWLDLGYHCTVLLHSQVHQWQNEKVEIGDLIAGLCMSVVKNALYRVIHLRDVSDLGNHIVVEGGTFCNDAVLRAFEKLLGHPVIRPDASGLMGAYGMALLAKERFASSHTSSLLSAEEIAALLVEEQQKRCPGCGNHCLLQQKLFSNGALFVTGNKCSRGEEMLLNGRKTGTYAPNLYEWEKEHLFRMQGVKRPLRGVVGIPRVLEMWSDFPYWQAFWASLGYRTVVSSYREEMMGRSASTVPHGIYCYPCKLAHGHVLDLLERKDISFLWMPVSHRGMEEPELDVLTHATYGDTIGQHMKRWSEKSGISILHPCVQPGKEEEIRSFIAENFPEISTEQITQAMEQAKEAMGRYEKGLTEETERVLEEIHREKKNALVLLGRNYHMDPEINKGLPMQIAKLGIPVLTAEGLYSLCPHKKEEPTFRDQALYAVEMAKKDPYLHLVQLQSTSCGYDGITMQEIRQGLASVGKIYTMLNLDQGISTGMLQIRIRSLMAEIKERQNHPEWVEPLPIEVHKEIPKQFYLAPLGKWYDRLLPAAWKPLGYEVTIAEAEWIQNDELPQEVEQDDGGMGQGAANTDRKPVVFLSSLTDARKAENFWDRHHSGWTALFMGLGRKQSDESPSTALFHQTWMALFLGDLLLRGYLAIRGVRNKEETERLLSQAETICVQALHRSSFAAYEEAVKQCMQLFSKAEKKETPILGLLGNPQTNMALAEDIYDRNKKPISIKMQGWGEFLLHELTELYFLEGFQGNPEAAQVCMASRKCAHTCLEMMLAQVNTSSVLDPLETPEEKKERLNRWRQAPERHLREPMADLIRRKVRKLILLGSRGKQEAAEVDILHHLYPSVEVLSLGDTRGLSLQGINRLELFLEN